MASVRSVALDVRSSGTTKTYEKKKHSMTKPAMTTTAGDVYKRQAYAQVAYSGNASRSANLGSTAGNWR